MHSTMLPHYENGNASTLNRQSDNGRLSRPRNLLHRYRWFLYAYAGVLTIAVIGCALFTPEQMVIADSLTKRKWGFDERPTTHQCYRQERTAMLLALFLGSFGVDQWYAHNWVLAVFKLITLGGVGLWSLIDMVLWIVGGIYTTPGCPGGY